MASQILPVASTSWEAYDRKTGLFELLMSTVEDVRPDCRRKVQAYSRDSRATVSLQRSRARVEEECRASLRVRRRRLAVRILGVACRAHGSRYTPVKGFSMKLLSLIICLLLLNLLPSAWSASSLATVPFATEREPMV